MAMAAGLVQHKVKVLILLNVLMLVYMVYFLGGDRSTPPTPTAHSAASAAVPTVVTAVAEATPRAGHEEALHGSAARVSYPSSRAPPTVDSNKHVARNDSVGVQNTIGLETASNKSFVITPTKTVDGTGVKVQLAPQFNGTNVTEVKHKDVSSQILKAAPRTTLSQETYHEAAPEHLEQPKALGETQPEGPRTTAVYSGSAAGRHTGLKIILMTSYRSGSSFVGEILSSNADAFYLFEPLWLLEMPPYGRSPVIDTAHHTITDADQQMYTDSVRELLHCNISAIVQASQQLFPGTAPAYRATWVSRMLGRGDLSISDAEALCRQKSHVVIKTIRLSPLSLVLQRLSARLRDVRIVYLVRDPRGMALSALKADVTDGRVHRRMLNDTLEQTNAKAMTYYANMKSYVESRCAILRENLQFLRFYNSIRKQLKLIRYEDFAYKPLRMATSLYENLGLNFSVQQANQLFSKTHAKNVGKKVGPYSTVRESSQTAEQWLKTAPKWLLTLFANCSDVISGFGYRVENNATQMSTLETVVGDLPPELPGLS